MLSAVNPPVEEAERRARDRAVLRVTNPQAPTPSRLEAWHREQEPGYDFQTWTTANGGYVIQLFRVRSYVNFCADCGELIVVRRFLSDSPKDRGGANWPTYCGVCVEDRARAHDAGAAERMREPRARQIAKRNANYESLGWICVHRKESRECPKNCGGYRKPYEKKKPRAAHPWPPQVTALPDW